MGKKYLAFFWTTILFLLLKRPLTRISVFNIVYFFLLNIFRTSRGNYYYGLFTLKGSSIHLLLPLTKESVATNHHNGQNYGGGGTIQSVGAFARCS